MKRFFLLSALLLGTLVTWADDYSAVVYPDCNQDTITRTIPATSDTIANWMSYFSDDTPLFDLTIPGMHEAGTWFFEYDRVRDMFVKDQEIDYKTAWDLGARAFDLRLAFESSTVLPGDDQSYKRFCKFHHGDNELAILVGAGPMNFITDDVENHFPTLEQLDDECMILIAKLEYVGDFYLLVGEQELVPITVDKTKIFEVLMTCLVNKYGADRFIPYHDGMSLGEVRGKIIMIVRTEEFTHSYSDISGTPQVPITYLTDMRNDWNIDTCIHTPVWVEVFENAEETHAYNNTYTQDIYKLEETDQDECATNAPHKCEAVVAMGKKEPKGALCINSFNSYCSNMFGLPYLWSISPSVHDSVIKALDNNIAAFKGLNLLDFYGIEVPNHYELYNFHNPEMTNKLIRSNFGRETLREISLHLSADDCNTHNTFTYTMPTATDITAEHQNGRYFSQWSDDNMDNPRSIWLTRDTTFTAIYNHNKLYQDDSKNGIVYNFTGRDCSTDDCSDAKTITLATNLGSATNIVRYVDDTLTTTIELMLDHSFGPKFLRWSDGSTDTVRTVSVTTDTTLTAIFTYDAPIYSDCEQDTLTINYVESGGVTLSLYCDGCDSTQHVTVQVHEGDLVKLIPTVDPTHHFVCWSDSVLDNPRVVTATSDMSFSATFAENAIMLYQNDSLNTPVYNFIGDYQYDIKTAPYTLLQVTGSDRRDTVYFRGYPYPNPTLIITAVPNDGFAFAGWADGCMDNPRQATAISDVVYKAIFSSNNVYIYQDCEKNGRSYQLTPTPAADHEYVDLGLPSGNLWSTKNMGASAPKEFGDTYAWGDTSPNPTEDIEHYCWADANGMLTRYCSDSQYGKVDNRTSLEDGDDVVKVQWKNDWRIPTKAELQELLDQCEWATRQIGGYTYKEGVGPSGDTIFLPLMQLPENSHHVGYYSSSDKEGTMTDWYNWVLYLSDWNKGDLPEMITENYRYRGGSIRPVRSHFDQPLNGAVYADGCPTGNTFSGYYKEQMSLTAVPQDGYHFLQWTDSVTDNPRLMSLWDGMSLTAQFAFDNQVFWDCSQNGNLYDYHRTGSKAVTLNLYADSCEQPNRFMLNDGDSICFKAVPVNGIRFVQWSDGVTDNPRWIKLNGDATFRAQFEPQSPDIFISSDDSKNGQDYNYYTPRQVGHEFVDLGLTSGLKWAAMNMGATSAEEKGDLYAWAEIDIKTDYSWVNYMWAYKEADQLKKYYEGDRCTQMKDEDDPAHSNWGGNWRCPTWVEVQELIDNCAMTNDTVNGVPGYRLTANNGNSIFTPSMTPDDYADCLFWSASLQPDYGGYSKAAVPGVQSTGLSGHFADRASGLPIRAVCNAGAHFKNITISSSTGDKTNVFRIDDDIPYVYIRANAEDGYRFVQWADSVTDNPRLVTMDADVELTAEFAENEVIVSNDCDNMTTSSLPPVDCPSGDCDSVHLLTLQVVGCEQTDTLRFADTLITSLTATPVEGYVFTGWSDGSGDSARIMTLSSDTALTAYFYRDVTDTIYQDCSLNGATYDYRTTEADPRRILLYADSCAAADTILVNYGAVLTTTAVAEAGYYFARWSDGVSVNPRVDTITTDTILRAEFLHARNILVYFDCAQNDSVFDLHTSNQDVDTIRLSVDSCDVSSIVLLNRGSSFVVEALAPRGYQLAQWTDNVTDNPRTIIANGNATYLAQYKRLKMPIYSNCQDYQTIYHFGPDSCNNGGDCNMRLAKINAHCSDPYQFDFADSISVYLLPQISINNHFEQWEDGCQDNPRLVTVNTDTTFSISFVSNKIELYRDNRKNVDTIYDFTNHTLADSTHIHTLTVRCKDTDIALLARFTDSCQVDLSATPCMGYRFVQWSDGDTLAARTETIYGDTTFTAEFEMVTIDIAQSCGYNNGYCDYSSSDQDIVTVLLSADGCESMDTVLINSGGQMSISASANVNNRFLQWSDGNTDNPRVFVPTTDTTLLAKFCDFISITITADSVEKITGVPDTTLTWQITHGYPDKGDTIVGVSLTRDQGEDPGVYTIHVEVVDSLNPKYNITTQDGHMRIYDGEHRMPKDATKTTIGYESEHWYNRENGIYYTDGYMNEMIADSVPLTTYLMYDDIRHDCRKFDFQSYYDLFGHTFSYIAVTTYEDASNTDTKWAEFSVAHPNVSNARLLWYKNWADPNYGQFNINVLLNDTTVFYIHQDYQVIGGFNAVYFSALKQNDIVRFQVERPNPAQWGATVTVAAVLQYTQAPEDATDMESVDSAKGNKQGVKFIRDGQLFILRDDKLYNAQGILMSTH